MLTTDKYVDGLVASASSQITNAAQRFYDPLSGTVEVDGIDIRNIKLRWYVPFLSVSSVNTVFSGDEKGLFQNPDQIFHTHNCLI
jgi:ABC-type transport system involved in Fe-S cluster assembly fused permease/ATPase subunit